MQKNLPSFTAKNGLTVKYHFYVGGNIYTTNSCNVVFVGPCRVEFIDWHVDEINYPKKDVEINGIYPTGWILEHNFEFKLQMKKDRYFSFDTKCNKTEISREEFGEIFKQLTTCTLDQHNAYLEAANELVPDADMPYF